MIGKLIYYFHIYMLCVLVGFLWSPIQAQITIDGQTLFGNEWIDYSKTYYKIQISEDGLYRIHLDELSGLDITNRPMSEFALYWMGEEIPIYTTGDSLMTDGDYIEFYSRKMRTELDRHLYTDADNQMLNPHVALHGEVSSYFLTNSPQGTRKRVLNIENVPATDETPTLLSYIHEELVAPSESWIKTRILSQDLSYSTFDRGEGFGSSLLNGGDNTVYETLIPTSEIVENGTNAKLNIRIAGLQSRSSHEVSIQWNGNELISKTFNTNESISNIVLENISLPLSDLEGVNAFRSASVGQGTPFDRHSIGAITLSYPRAFNAQGDSLFAFTIEGETATSAIEIGHVPESGIPVLHSLTHSIRMIGMRVEDVVQFVIPVEYINGDYILQVEESIDSKVEVTPSVFQDLQTSVADYLIISHSSLHGSDPSADPVSDYVEYRSSDAGGGYQVQLIDISQLQDQFAYGVEGHPLAIKSFINYTVGRWPNVKHVLLLGKGITYDKVRLPHITSSNKLDLIPTYGNPGSDNYLMSAGRNPTPIYSVGRIPASDSDGVSRYLDKLIEMETALADDPQDLGKLWQKQIVHLSGGNGLGEQTSILRSLNEARAFIEGNKSGSNVLTTTKLSSDVIEDVSPDSEALKRINNGVLFKTYFGHGAETATQFDALENPRFLDNDGRYPIMSALGCKTGNCFTIESTSYGERNILEAQKGAINYIATSGFGRIDNIDNYMTIWYDLLSGDMYGNSVGEVYKEALKASLPFNAGSARTLNEQLILQGDPAFTPFIQRGPDYIIDNTSVVLNPAVVTVGAGNYDMGLDIYNLGVFVDDSLTLSVTQITPSGRTIFLGNFHVKSPAFKNSITLRLPNDNESNVGLNTLSIVIDPDNIKEELPSPSAELNNNLISSSGKEGFDFLVINRGLSPIYPREFSIIDDVNPILYANTNNPLSDIQNYVFQLDTTALFNSSLLERQSLSQGGGVVEFTPIQSLLPNVVYYWRVSPDSLNNQMGYSWSQSSLTYIPNISDGWNQAHFDQYIRNDFTQGSADAESRQLELNTVSTTIKLINRIGAHPSGQPMLVINGIENRQVWPWRMAGLSQTFQVLVLTQRNQLLKLNQPPGEFGSFNTSTKAEPNFPFDVHSIQGRQALINFLENEVDDGDHVIVYAVLTNILSDTSTVGWEEDIDQFDNSIYTYLESLGASQVSLMKDRGLVPYIFAYQKGGDVFSEIIADNQDGQIVMNQVASTYSNQIAWQSPTIGPVDSWNRIEWSVDDNKPVSDSCLLDIIGLDGNAEILIATLNQNQSSFDLTSVDFKEIRLGYRCSDMSIPRHASQPEYVRVLYQGLPELSIDANSSYAFHDDTLQQGELMTLSYTIRNISPYPADSFLNRIAIKNKSLGEIIENQRLAPIGPHQEIQANYSFNTANTLGDHELIVQVDPDQESGDVVLQNNQFFEKFYVVKDGINPLLEVTFDGVYILDGDLVSSRPLILIELNDENELFLLNDTSLFSIEIKYPFEPFIPISFNDEYVNFIPATDVNNNRAKIELTPFLATDGLYRLRVNAKDATQNASGIGEYAISFEVDNRKAISHVLNYPNPFSTSTQFVYTLTGDTPPENYKIQIISASGKVVREISKDEIGPLKIGQHKTEYAWDGTDEYGDRLANGIYLYRFDISDSDEEAFESKNTQVDRFFKNDFSKLVILR